MQNGQRILASRFQLSNDSSDRYERGPDIDLSSPFSVDFIKVGPRLGWRWTNLAERKPQSCEINWLDSEPVLGTEDYEECQKELQNSKDSESFYKGHWKPPTEEEYRKMMFKRQAESRLLFNLFQRLPFLTAPAPNNMLLGEHNNDEEDAGTLAQYILVMISNNPGLVLAFLVWLIMVILPIIASVVKEYFVT